MKLSWTASSIEKADIILQNFFRTVNEGDSLFIRLSDEKDGQPGKPGIYFKNDDTFINVVDLSEKESRLYLPYLLHGEKIKGTVSSTNKDTIKNEITISAEFPDVEKIPSEPVKSERILLSEIAAYLEKQTQYQKTIKNIVVFFLVISIIAAVIVFFSAVL